MSIDLSIIIPVFNGENYLNKCIESIFLQENISIEIIIIDDFSTDGTVLLLNNSYEENRVTLLLNDKNRGQGPCRNDGIKVACGKYILFIDVDDYLTDENVQVLSKIVKRMDSETLDVINCPYYVHEKHKKKKGIQDNNVYLSGKEYLNSVDVLEVVVWNKIYRREFLIQNELFFKSRKYEDVSFVIESYLKAGKVANDTSFFYNYIIRENSTMTAPPKVQNVIDVLGLVNDLEVFYIDNKRIFQVEKTFFYSFIGAARIIKGYGVNNKNINKEVCKFRMLHREYRRSIFNSKSLNLILRIFLFISPFYANRFLEILKK